MSSSKNIKESLVASVMQFLSDELADQSTTDEAKESIEVAIQCLETAYNINPVDGSLPSKKPLLKIFSSYFENNTEETEAKSIVSEEDKIKADAFKNEGNELMKNGKFHEALDAYTNAIKIDGTNPIYFCNRAAAHSKLENYQATIEDCKIAIKHDPSYSKAYCRMGLAFVNMKDFQRARDCYKKAVELDPSESNVNNLNLAESSLQEEQERFQSGFNLGNILNNPQLMNFATKMMSDPQMTQMLSNFMGTSETLGSSEGQGSGMDAFLKSGQEFAKKMQEDHPEIIADLKKAFKKDDETNDDDKDGGQTN